MKLLKSVANTPIFSLLFQFLQTNVDDDASEPTLDGTDVGHVILNIKDGHLFLASGFNGNPNVDFIELYSNYVELYYASLLNEALQINLMEDALCVDYVERTIYPSEPSVQWKCNSTARDSAMLSLAMKSTSFTDQKRKVKLLMFLFSGGLKSTDLQWLYMIAFR